MNEKEFKPFWAWVGDTEEDIRIKKDKDCRRLVVAVVENGGLCLAMDANREKEKPTTYNISAWKFHERCPEPKKRPMTVEEISELPYIVRKNSNCMYRWHERNGKGFWFMSGYWSHDAILSNFLQPNGEPLEVEE